MSYITNLFKKYNSIENSYQEDFINSIIEEGFGNEEFIVQEKVHGANLSFITDGQNIFSAKRTELILEGEDFYNSEFVFNNYKDKVQSLFKAISSDINIKTITVFGELFGGGYPHPDITKDDTAKLVQRGIYYCPHNDFYAFDILLDNNKYMNVDVANTYFEKIGFIYAKTLFKGSLKDCLSYPNTFKTKIPAEYKLPELEGNICEGVVIRPVKSAFLKGGSRVIIKNKNEKWSENNNFIDNSMLRTIFNDGDELSDEAIALCEEIYKLITQNRLDNLISKIGIVNHKKDFGKVLGLYNKDALNDFLKIFHNRYNALEKVEAKAINKFLNKHAGHLINDYFDNL